MLAYVTILSLALLFNYSASVVSNSQGEHNE